MSDDRPQWVCFGDPPGKFSSSSYFTIEWDDESVERARRQHEETLALWRANPMWREISPGCFERVSEDAGLAE